MKKIFFIVIFVLFILMVAGAAVSYLNWGRDQKVIPPVSQNDEQVLNEKIDTYSGNLIKDNPGLRQGIWYILYEQPGESALNAMLVFDEKSICSNGGAAESCDPLKFENGSKASVAGIAQENGSILVMDMAITPLSKTQKILIYFYNPNTDKDTSGNIMCSRAGLAGVSREIPITKTPIQDAIRLLLSGNVMESEKKAGISTEFPLPGLELKGVNLKNGVLTLEFRDPENRTGGGSCRAAVLWFQIEATAKQFPEVDTVRFVPETLFQP